MPSRFMPFLLLFTALGAPAFAQSPPPAVSSHAVASRVEGEHVHYYPTLHEAFQAATGLSIEIPDEITLFADITVYDPLIIEDGKHIRLVAGDGDRTIQRGDGLLDYPLIWVRGENASLSLGKLNMSGSLIIDGGCLNSPPVIANAPLAAVNGPDSKLIMYDGVSLQNNNNSSRPTDTSIYENGGGVFIRTAGDKMNNLAEFIMRGGVIQGNINSARSGVASGGGVLLTGFGRFTMEGGVIKNNTAYHAGGGVHSGSRASWRKTGGIIYGRNAPVGLRNIAVDGNGSPIVFGHAVSVFLVGYPIAQYRNDTVGDTDSLSYTGDPAARGVFGEGEKWDNHEKVLRRRLVIIIPAVLVLGVFVFLVVRKKIRQNRKETTYVPESIDLELTDHEKKVLDLLLTDFSIKMIADALELTYEGVRFHCKKLYHKLNVKNRKELLVKYQKRGNGE